jgi:CRP-like cAMP-binding protein
MLLTSRHVSDNILLGHLTASGRAALSPWLRTERLVQGTALTRRWRPVTHVWFPIVGLVSLVVALEDGRMAEAAAIGREGGVGLEAAFEPSVALSDSVVQIGGEFSVIRADNLRSVVAAHPSVAVNFSRYGRVLTAQLEQSVACNNLHRLEARCCRWLITAKDRSGVDELPVTQERLAGILGAGRPGISLVLSALERAGLIRQRRSRVQILDRAGLLARACECHEVIVQMSSRLALDG